MQEVLLNTIVKSFVNFIHKESDYICNRDRLSEENKDEINIYQFNINTTIESDGDISVEAELELKPISSNQQWIYLTMYFDLEVDSIFWNGNKAEYFFKGEENPWLWIRTPQDFNINTSYKLKIYYKGDVLERKWDSYYLKSSIGWYPSYNRKRKSIYNLTFHTPESNEFISVGDLVSKNIHEGIRTTNWVTKKPIRNASFNIGYFEVEQIEDNRIPLVNVYMSEYGHAEMAQYLVQQGIATNSNMKDQVAADVANSLAFFKEKFGSPPTYSLNVTEIPFAHGEAFPGLIHLSWATTFQFTETFGFNEYFRAHEVAHQWWAIGVDYKTYHDQWLSEGFASYSGLWFLQATSDDKESFFRILDKWGEEIIENRNYIFESGQEAGPIWLGWRTNSSQTKGDYSLIIYRKGAWILHMLRHIMMDFNTFDQSGFENMMKDFYFTYRGKEATTQDFKNMVDKHMGTDMSWFFNQWVYGTDIPFYTVSFDEHELDNGKYRVKYKIIQENTKPDFQMVVPIHIAFGDDQFTVIKIWIKGPITEGYLPILPMEPEEITFNPLSSVLCKVKYTSP